MTAVAGARMCSTVSGFSPRNTAIRVTIRKSSDVSFIDAFVDMQTASLFLYIRPCQPPTLTSIKDGQGIKCLHN
jgi:hypothetical protein